MMKRLLTVVLIVLFGAASSALTQSRATRPSRRQNSSGQNSSVRRAVILTTDCGADMDDQWTLAQLALAPELELRGVVTTHAPSLAAPAAETSARVVGEVLDHLPVNARPPIFAGSSTPLASRDTPLSNRGVEFIIEQSHAYSPARRLAVLITGAATDVASALLVDSTLGNRIEIVAMGFEGWPEGNDSWNVKNDVRAWQIILESRAPIVVGDAHITRRDLAMTRARARELFLGRGVAGRYLADVHAAWLDRDPQFVQSVTGNRETWPIWDQVTLAYLLGMTESLSYPRPALRDDMRFIHPISRTREADLRWITRIDATRLWNHFTTNLDRANARRRTMG